VRGRPRGLGSRAGQVGGDAPSCGAPGAATIGRMTDTPPDDTVDNLEDADLGEYEPV